MGVCWHIVSVACASQPYAQSVMRMGKAVGDRVQLHPAPVSHRILYIVHPRR